MTSNKEQDYYRRHSPHSQVQWLSSAGQDSEAILTNDALLAGVSRNAICY